MERSPNNPPQNPSAAWYRVSFLLVLAGFVYSLLLGGWRQFFDLVAGRGFRAPGPEHWRATLVWLGSVLPLLVLSIRLGVRSESARRLDLVVWKGLVAAWRLAWADAEPSDLADEFARPPEDDVAAAWRWGVVVGLTPLVLFLGLIETLRTTAGFVWVGGAGVLFGIASYNRRRARAYLRDEPGLFDPFRQWKLLSLARYDPAGHRFVQAEIICALILPIWWLGVGALVIGRQ